MITSLPENSGSRNAGSPRSFPPPRLGGGSSEGQRPTLNIFRSVRRHVSVFLIVFFVLFGCGAFVFRTKTKPVYSSQSGVYISPTFPKVLNPDSEVELPYDSYFQDQIQTVTRYDIVADAISQLSPEVRHRTGPPLPSEIAKLQHSLVITRIGTSYEMSIELRGSSPYGLADVVNAITNSYVERTRNEEFYGLGDRLNTLRQERGHLREQIDSGLAEQADLMQQLGVASVSTGNGATNPYDTSSNSVRNQLNLARMQREAAEAQLDTSLKGDGPGEASALDTAAEEAITADPALSGVWTTLSNRRGLLLEEMSGLRPEHPIHQKDQDELSSIDGVMGDLRHKAAAQLQGKLRRDVERTRLVELKLTQELNENTQNAAAAAPKYQRAIELGPEIESLQKTYEAIDDRIRDLELESTSPGSVHVSTKALTPSSPEHGGLPLYALALVLISLAGASAVAIGIDLFDSRIYLAEDIERVVGFHPIGILLDTDEFSEEAAKDYYFRLAAGIDNAVRNAGARSFLFTSPAHGAGTSTIIRRLSEELCGLNLRCRTIKAAGSGGTEDSSLRGAFSRSELLLQGSNDNDDVQQAPLAKGAAYNRRGPQMEEDTAPVNSAEQALQHEGVGYDVVLIDSDPLPISGNTEYLARVVDATVLVIKAGTTTRQELHRAAQLLERLQVAGVAVVLNKIRLERADRDLRRELCYKPNLKQEEKAIIASDKVSPASTQNSTLAPGSIFPTRTAVTALKPEIGQTAQSVNDQRAISQVDEISRDKESAKIRFKLGPRLRISLIIVVLAAAPVALATGYFVARHQTAAAAVAALAHRVVASRATFPVEQKVSSMQPVEASSAVNVNVSSTRVSSPPPKVLRTDSPTSTPSERPEHLVPPTKADTSAAFSKPVLKSSSLSAPIEPPSITGIPTKGFDLERGLLGASAISPAGPGANVVSNPQPPKLLSSPPPNYPSFARMGHMGGPVLIDAVVDETGKVSDTKVISGNPVLTQAAVEALRMWKYQPARLNGQPTAAHVQVRFDFVPH